VKSRARHGSHRQKSRRETRRIIEISNVAVLRYRQVEMSEGEVEDLTIAARQNEENFVQTIFAREFYYLT